MGFHCFQYIMFTPYGIVLPKDELILIVMTLICICFPQDSQLYHHLTHPRYTSTVKALQ